MPPESPSYRIEKREPYEKYGGKKHLTSISMYRCDTWDVIGPGVYCACSSEREAQLVCDALNASRHKGKEGCALNLT